MNRRLSVLKQWGRERLGSKSRTEPSDEFTELQEDLQLRHDGTQDLYRSMGTYIKWLRKRKRDPTHGKQIPIACVSAEMQRHGQRLDEDSDYGLCLLSMASACDCLARAQEAFAANVNNCWFESLERSLEHMRLCHVARRQMESHRLAYDAARTRATKSRKQDTRLQEQVGVLRETYEDSHDIVLDHMLEIRDAEVDTLADLGSFLDAQLAYHERCADILRRTKVDWPVETLRGSDVASLETSVAPRYRRAQSLASTANILNSTIGGAGLTADDATVASGSSRGTSSSSASSTSRR